MGSSIIHLVIVVIIVRIRQFGISESTHKSTTQMVAVNEFTKSHTLLTLKKQRLACIQVEVPTHINTHTHTHTHTRPDFTTCARTQRHTHTH